jgi:hypothetical protein
MLKRFEKRVPKLTQQRTAAVLNKIYPPEIYEKEITIENRTRSLDSITNRRTRGSMDDDRNTDRMVSEYNSRINSEKKRKRQTPATIGNHYFLPKLNSQNSIQYNPVESSKNILPPSSNLNQHQIKIVKKSHIHDIVSRERFGVTANFGSNMKNRFYDDRVSVASTKESRL